MQRSPGVPLGMPHSCALGSYSCALFMDVASTADMALQVAEAHRTCGNTTSQGAIMNLSPIEDETKPEARRENDAEMRLGRSVEAGVS